VSIGSDFDVTIVVPTRNSGRTLRACLESIRGQTRNCQIVVVDNFSADESRAIADELADVVLEMGPERSAQRNAGAKVSQSSIIGFIDSDMLLGINVVDEVVASISSGTASVVVPEVTIGEGFWAKVSAYERSFYVGNDNVEAPRFFRRTVFSEAEGFDESMTGAEDWDLGLRTLKLGPRSRTQSVILHDEGRVRYFSLCRKKLYYASGLMKFGKKHGVEALVNTTRRRWLRSLRALANPLGLGLVVLKAGEVVAVASGLLWLSLGGNIELQRPTRNYDR
jgi:glycosyltransferase involved in cell wall biosynthesis